MKKFSRLILAGALVLVASSASADTLYWQVTADSGQQFDEAWLVADNGTKTYVDNAESDGGNPSSTQLIQSDISNYTGEGWSFYIEMCNYNSQDDTYTTVATGNSYSYDQLLSSGYVATDSVNANSVMTAASAANMGAGDVPEPSSGLLLLMGGAMLALRRRRQK